MAYLNPAWLTEVNALPPAVGFIVYAVPYPVTFGAPAFTRAWYHRTLKAAQRRLGSVCSGKLHLHNDNAAFVMTPTGEVLSWNDINTRLTV